MPMVLLPFYLGNGGATQALEVEMDDLSLSFSATMLKASLGRKKTKKRKRSHERNTLR
ncbi:MAG: hypothetical protein JXQ96_15415 [Cyclobacteriaceae bacterium]